MVCRVGGRGGACFWNPGGNKSRGVGIVCNVSLDFEDLEVKRDFHGHLIKKKTVLTRLEVSDHVYLCSKRPKGQIRVLFEFVKTHVPRDTSVFGR